MSEVAKLVEKWRTRAVNCDAGILARKHIEGCANELYAALAAAPPEQAAVQQVGASRCSSTEADAKDGTDNSSCREQGVTGSMPQAVSAGALSAGTWALETMQIINKLTPDIKGKAFDPDWFLLRQRLEEFESRLAAHDQKVRAEVLEEIALFADTQSYPYHSFFADKIRALVVK